MNPSLYEMLTLNFTSELDLHQIEERDQVIMSVLDNIQRILNGRAGSLKHLPDYGLSDFSTVLSELPSSAHRLINTIEQTLLNYEPRLKSVRVTLQPAPAPVHLRYAIDAELKGIGLVRFSSEFVPEGRVLIRHLRARGMES